MVNTRSGSVYDLTIPPRPKQPRQPSEYNMFLKETIALLKEQGVSNHRDRFKQAAMMWKKHHE